jgi:hypothetical protein
MDSAGIMMSTKIPNQTKRCILAKDILMDRTLSKKYQVNVKNKVSNITLKAASMYKSSFILCSKSIIWNMSTPNM